MQISFSKDLLKGAGVALGIAAVALGAHYAWNKRATRFGRGLTQCESTLFSSKQIGITVPFQQCQEDDPFSLRAVGNTLYLVRRSAVQAAVRSGLPVLDYFKKNADETADQAISRQFVSAQDAANGCRVAPVNIKGVTSDAKQTFEVVDSVGSGEGCGEFGGAPKQQYFEYHPAESKTRFLFIRRGEDIDRYIDTASIRIGNP